MADVEDILGRMRANPKGIRFADLCKAKAYQVRQVLAAIERLERERAEET